MVFFRLKKIKTKEYCYLVENEWGKEGPRQKVKQYLGKAYRVGLINDVDFFSFKKIDNLNEYLKFDLKSILKDLLEWESFRHELAKDFVMDLGKKLIQANGKKCVIMVNEGYLCSLTLANLFEFMPYSTSNDTFRFARIFVEAGIKIPKEIFVGLSEKILKFEQD